MGYQSLSTTLVFKGLVLITLLASSIRVPAQSNFSIQGQVIDAKTGQPLPFVALSVANGQLSNEANRDGYFRINLPDQLRQDTLLVTTTDYQQAKIPLSTVPQTDYVIRLTPHLTQREPTTADTYFSLNPTISGPGYVIEGGSVYS